MKIGLLPLGRPTFDVAFAEEKLAAMVTALDTTGHEIVGPRELLVDEAATRDAIADLAAENIDQVLLLQVTFTDAATAIAAAASFNQPLSIWAVPEPRLGGRLRLNAFCGLNLAAHALGLNGRAFSWLYADPEDDVENELTDLFFGKRTAGRLDAVPVTKCTPEGARVVEALKGQKIAKIGEHPTGFETCAYSPDKLKDLAGLSVDDFALEDLFDAARETSAGIAEALRGQAASDVDGLDTVDQAGLDRSLRLKAGLEVLKDRGGYSAFAIRCWPETFTEYGGAVCGPAAMMGEGQVPCACEADVYGAFTQLLLLQVAQAPVFLTDLVDMDSDDDTGVVWHCGQAPISMRDTDAQATATIHTNRKQPLLYQFPLRPGPVTFLRMSQAFGEPKMVLAQGEMVRRPMSFTGTSGVVRFERPAALVLKDIIASGLEHHMALAYGNHRETLRAVAAEMSLPVLEI